MCRDDRCFEIDGEIDDLLRLADELVEPFLTIVWLPEVTAQRTDYQPVAVHEMEKVTSTGLREVVRVHFAVCDVDLKPIRAKLGSFRDSAPHTESERLDHYTNLEPAHVSPPVSSSGNTMICETRR